jgi:hypothetical protein
MLAVVLSLAISFSPFSKSKEELFMCNRDAASILIISGTAASVLGTFLFFGFPPDEEGLRYSSSLLVGVSLPAAVLGILMMNKQDTKGCR